MKRVSKIILSVFITASMLASVVSSSFAVSNVYTAQNLNALKVSPYKDVTSAKVQKAMTDKFITNSKKGSKSMFSKKYLPYAGNALAPKASFSNVKYTYSKNVTKLPANTLSFLDDDAAPQHDFAAKLGIKNKTIKSDQIFIDESAKKALKITANKAETGLFDVGSPKMNEVFDEFEIKEERLHLKEGNISSTAVPYKTVPASKFLKNSMIKKGLKPLVESGTAGNSGTTANAFAPPPSMPLLAMDGSIQGCQLFSPDNNPLLSSLNDDNCIQFDFPETALKAETSDGSSIEVRLSGNVKVGGLDVVGKYSMFDGYRFTLTCAEEMNVQLKAIATLNKEVYIPIAALDIPFAIGNVRAGLYLVAQVNGDFILELKVSQGLEVEAGISGGTFFGVPVSIRPVFKPEAYVDITDNFEGVFNGTMGLGPVLQVNLMGMDILAAELRLGGGIGAVVQGDNINIDVDAILLAYFTILDKKVTLLDKHWDLYSKQKRNTGGYRITVTDRCAYRNLVSGKIEELTKDMNNPTKPCKDKKVDIVISNKGKQKYIDQKTTDSNGDFSVQFTDALCDMVNGDTVQLKITGKDNKTYSNEPLPVTFPFDGSKASLEYADYFEDKVSGKVGVVQVGKDANGVPIFLDYNKKVEVTLSNGKSQKYDCKNGLFSGPFTQGILPKQTARIKIISDGFIIEGSAYNQKQTDCGIQVSVEPVYMRDIVWANDDIPQGYSGPFTNIFWAKTIDEYTFIQVTVNNTRGVRTPLENVTVRTGFGCDYLNSNTHLLEILPIQGTQKTSNIPVAQQIPGMSRGIELYTYRWINPEKVSAFNSNNNSILSMLPVHYASNSAGFTLPSAASSQFAAVVPDTNRQTVESGAKKMQINYGPVLLKQIRETWKVPNFEDSKAYWKTAIAADFTDKRNTPVYDNRSYQNNLYPYYFYTTAEFKFEGASTFGGYHDFHKGIGVKYIPKESTEYNGN